MANKTPDQLLKELLDLQKKYSFEARFMVTQERYQNIYESGLMKELDVMSEAIREPLIQHVGHLPILATYLHPNIEHTNEVDIGYCLQMLAIHDIGETEVGDEFAYTKTNEHEDIEREAALRILHPNYHEMFVEFEDRETINAKFAKAIDSLAPLLMEITIPHLTKERFEKLNFSRAKIKAKKEPHFEWDSVMKELFELIMEEYKKIEELKI